jgi:hypothetical protein
MLVISVDTPLRFLEHIRSFGNKASFHAKYVFVALCVTVSAYSAVLGAALSVPLRYNDYYPPSISAAFSSSTGLTSYYICTIYAFALERNAYEFFVDLHERATTKGTLYGALWARIVLANTLMVFLFLLGAITNEREQRTHNAFALSAIINHLALEVVSIGIRLNKSLSVVRKVLLGLESSLVAAAVMFGLCFTNVIETCPSSSVVSSVSEYFLFLVVVVTPAFRILDD